MRLRIVWTGKTREAHLRALIDQYLQRLSHFAKCEVSELRETAAPGKVGIDKDSQRISDGLREGAITILLDPEGDEWTSTQVARQIEQWRRQGSDFYRRWAQWSFWETGSPRQQTLEPFAIDADA